MPDIKDPEILRQLVAHQIILRIASLASCLLCVRHDSEASKLAMDRITHMCAPHVVLPPDTYELLQATKDDHPDIASFLFGLIDKIGANRYQLNDPATLISMLDRMLPTLKGLEQRPDKYMAVWTYLSVCK